ncbi:MAG TPA: hypothetical protein VK716_07945 [Terracidiphilus sp.]|jgi:hypothetical protein|nr:hypothetical protein [Terracidiphilus sp.]
MLDYFTNTQLIVAGAALAIAIIAVVSYFFIRTTKTRGLRARFGPEYDRAVAVHGSSREAEAKLADRETRVKSLGLRTLANTERERFVAEWKTVQAHFVDQPKSAVSEADVLISALLVALGYPKGGFEQSAADISVSYPSLTEEYRLANAIAVRAGRADASTEELRTAMIQYRAIFDELVQVQKA